MTNKRTRSISIIIAIVMFITMLTAVITQGFTDFNPYGWFKEKEETKLPETSDNLQFGYDNNGLISMSAKLIAPSEYGNYGVALENIESAYTLTATVTPENATYKEVDWFIAWKNANSTFAVGKTVTDYVTITPTSDGALEAVVECKQDFGEAIEVTVHCSYDETIKAVVSVDYVKKIYDVVTVNGEELTNASIVNGDGNVLYEDSYFGYAYTNYTIDSTYTFDVKIKFNSVFESELRTRFGLLELRSKSEDGIYELTHTGNFISNLLLSPGNITDIRNISRCNSALDNFYKSYPNEAIAQIIINAEDVENGISFTKTIDIYGQEINEVFVNSIDVNNTSIKF